MVTLATGLLIVLWICTRAAPEQSSLVFGLGIVWLALCLLLRLALSY